MNVLTTPLPGVLIVEPKVIGDSRGFFLETYHAARYAAAGIPGPFVQDNYSRSAPGVLRGLHYQLKRPQGKLVQCIRGRVFDVVVDIRRGSPTFAKWVGIELSEETHRQVWIPPGFAHGFCVPMDAGVTEFQYKCTDAYAPEDERGVIWNDTGIGVAWPVTQPLVSDKDRQYAPLAAERADLPAYVPAV